MKNVSFNIPPDLDNHSEKKGVGVATSIKIGIGPKTTLLNTERTVQQKLILDARTPVQNVTKNCTLITLKDLPFICLQASR